MTDGEEPLRDDAGNPESRLVFFSPDQIEILDTWRSSGLRGTGSHDFEVKDVFVPDGRSVVLGGRTRVKGPLYQFPTLGLLALGVSAVSLGMAERAIEEFVDLAAGKVPTGSTRSLANRPLAQAHVAKAEAAVVSARAFVEHSIDQAWAVAETGARLDEHVRAGLRLAAANATWQSASAVAHVYHAAGGTAVYETSVLQRCFRDVHVATQHIMVAEPTYELVGRVRLGLGVRKGTL